MPEWRSRTYTYSEPVEPDSDTNPDSILRSAGNRPDFDAGYDAGYRSGWVAGYEYARRLREHDLAVEEGGVSHPLLL